MRRIFGVLFVVGALFVFMNARTKTAQIDRDVRQDIRNAADARTRENEMASLRTKIPMENLAVADAIVKHTDQTAAEAAVDADKARLAELEQAETMLGSAAQNEEAAKSDETKRWIVLVEFAGSVLLGLVGIALLVK